MSERFAWIFDKQKQKKIWCADMWARKAVLAVQTAITGIVSRLTTVENAGYQTASDVSAAIATAIGGITELEYLVVSTLPASGTKGVIYLVPHQHGTRDIYDEYIWVNNAFEKIGSTDVDLSQYLLKADISAWAKASTKPTYTAAEVGALPDDTVIPIVPTDVSAFTNDAGYITGGKFAEVSGVLASAAGNSTAAAFPEGFTVANTFILSLMVKYNGNWWQVGDGVLTSNGRLYAQIVSAGIRVYNSSSFGYGIEWKAALMRTDI